MNKIIKLDETSINQIKSTISYNSIAGIIKELLQNSLDANASSISIILDFQSLSLFIQDNGTGISSSDYDKIGLKNYTSKSGDDYFGYKGEALHSLKTISKLTIISKIKNENTYKLVNGRAEIFQNDIIPSSYFNVSIKQHGTCIIANNCFQNIPVRKLQITSTSQLKIIEEVKLAIFGSIIPFTSTKLSFSIINHEKMQLDQILNVDAHGSLSILLQDIFGIKIKFENIGAKFKNVEMKGIIGKFPINTRNHQYLFINNRPIQLTKTESNNINSIFQNSDFIDETHLISPTRSTGRPFYKYATFVILVNCPKTISYSSNIYNTILQILEKVFYKFLESNGYGKRRNRMRKSPSPSTSPIKQRKIRDNFILYANSKLANYNDNELDGLKFNRNGKSSISTIPNFSINSTAPTPQIHNCEVIPDQVARSINFSKSDIQQFKIIKQIDKKFILINSESQLVILDQHAIDERVKVEQLLQEFINTLKLNTGLRLANPLSFNLIVHGEINLFKTYKSNFNIFGIDYEIQEDNVIVTHLPNVLLGKVKSGSEFLKNALLQHCYDLNLNYKRKVLDLDDWFACIHHIPKIIIEVINSKACRSAIMFGDELSNQECEELLNELRNCQLPFICAHGRPSIVPLAKIE
ncbi:unnamed protein product [Candida verbasci]|uniref:MutL C-terminal dimerisation domain-containing protein n=1 Tax=Candida verbasci TaxID=1227364 RepID=A0A9W4TS34_9ASCO|nr:unnamed protein product [Candida verbasci]